MSDRKEKDEMVKTANDDLQLVPQVEDEREIVSEEQFEPDMILVPVHCSACHLLMYSAEKNIGKWMICPDCGRENEIHKPMERFRYVVEISEEGALKILPVTEPKTPKPEKVTDYRKVSGAVDEGAEFLPVLDWGEDLADPLEKVFDKILNKKSGKQKDEEETFTSKESQAIRETRSKKSITENREKYYQEERRGSDLLYETIEPSDDIYQTEIPVSCSVQRSVSEKTQSNMTQIDQQVPVLQQESVSKQVPISHKKSVADFGGEKAESATKGDNRTQRGEDERDKGDNRVDRLEGVESTEKALNPGALNHFFLPFIDSRNRFRLLFSVVLGAVAFFMTFNIFRLFGQVLFSADPRGPDYVYQWLDIFLFIVEYLTALLPLAIWMVLLILNGMTLFDKTRLGYCRICQWQSFRAEFVFQYLLWLFVVFLISPFPGVLISFAIHLLIGNVPWRLLAILTSIYIMFPVLLLSIVENDSGLELFHLRVWKSLYTKARAWLLYYIGAFPLVALMIAVLIGCCCVQIYCVDKNFSKVIIPFGTASLLACPLVTASILFYFRLLGALAWIIDD